LYAIHAQLAGDLDVPLMERAMFNRVQQAIAKRQCRTETAGAAVFGGWLWGNPIHRCIGKVVERVMHQPNQPS